MRATLLILSISLLIIGTPSAQQQSPASVDCDRLLNTANSMATTLFTLARKTFVENESRGETWILRVHDGAGPRSLKKYTDGKHVIVSIPVLTFEKEGMSLYVSHYNAETVRKADRLVFEGKCQEAMKIYSLVKRFNNCQLSKSDDVNIRIDYLDKILNGADKASLVEKIRELNIKSAAPRFEQIGSKPAVQVTNLMKLTIDEWALD